MTSVNHASGPFPTCCCEIAVTSRSVATLFTEVHPPPWPAPGRVRWQPLRSCAGRAKSTAWCDRRPGQLGWLVTSFERGPPVCRGGGAKQQRAGGGRPGETAGQPPRLKGRQDDRQRENNERLDRERRPGQPRGPGADDGDGGNKDHGRAGESDQTGVRVQAANIQLHQAASRGQRCPQVCRKRQRGLAVSSASQALTRWSPHVLAATPTTIRTAVASSGNSLLTSRRLSAVTRARPLTAARGTAALLYPGRARARA